MLWVLGISFMMIVGGFLQKLWICGIGIFCLLSRLRMFVLWCSFGNGLMLLLCLLWMCRWRIFFLWCMFRFQVGCQCGRCCMVVIWLLFSCLMKVCSFCLMSVLVFFCVFSDCICFFRNCLVFCFVQVGVVDLIECYVFFFCQVGSIQVFVLGFDQVLFVEFVDCYY